MTPSPRTLRKHLHYQFVVYTRKSAKRTADIQLILTFLDGRICHFRHSYHSQVPRSICVRVIRPDELVIRRRRQFLFLRRKIIKRLKMNRLRQVAELQRQGAVNPTNIDDRGHWTWTGQARTVRFLPSIHLSSTLPLYFVKP